MNVRPILAQDGQPYDLTYKLHKDAARQQGVNDIRQIKEAGQHRKPTDEEKGEVGKILGFMQPGEHSKKISVLSGCIRNTGVSQDESVDRGKGRPQEIGRASCRERV